MKRESLLKIVLPIAVVLVAALGAWAMFLTKEQPRTQVPERIAPLVRVMTVELRDVAMIVTSQGTVSPRTESTLVTEVAGRVIEVSPVFAAGGFFARGDLLLRIDPHDYRESLIQAKARVAQAELRVAQEQAEADVARREWQELEGGTASPLTLRAPQLAEATAALESARALVERAERDLERTVVRAPYDGRIRDKRADVGQFVVAGTPLATIYAVDWAEVRLPLPDRDLAFLDLPLDFRDDAQRADGPLVVLRAEFAGKTHEWSARIVRTEGEIDPRSRMVHAIARVKGPYDRGGDPERPPLAVGLFVVAEIHGREAQSVAVVPRMAVRGDGRVLIVDDESRLRFREVQVIRTDSDRVVIGSGLEEGSRVVLTSLSAVTDGMQVRVADDAPDDAGLARDGA